MSKYWLKVNTFEEFQTALDGRRLWIMEQWKGGPRWYLVRRNGATKRWLKKSNKHRWEIPIKWKLDVCLRVGDYNFDMIRDRLKAGVGHEFLDPRGNGLENDPGNPLADEGGKAYFERYIAGDR